MSNCEQGKMGEIPGIDEYQSFHYDDETDSGFIIRNEGDGLFKAEEWRNGDIADNAYGTYAEMKAWTEKAAAPHDHWRIENGYKPFLGEPRKLSATDLGALADKAFEDYEFGNGVEVTDSSGWEYSTPGFERSRKVFVETEREDDGPAPRWTLTFTVRFNPDDGTLAEAYAIDQNGQIWGSLPERKLSEVRFDQPVGYSMGGFVVGHLAKMNGNPDVATIVGIKDDNGRTKVTIQFADPQPVDAPQGATSSRFELDWRAISCTWAPSTDELKSRQRGKLQENANKLEAKWRSSSFAWRYLLMSAAGVIPGGYSEDIPPPLRIDLRRKMEELVQNGWEPDWQKAVAYFASNDTMVEWSRMFDEAQSMAERKLVQDDTSSLMKDAQWILTFLKTIEAEGRHAPTETMQRLIDSIGALHVKPRIVIGLDGGIIQGATANMPIEYLVYDYDIEGADADEIAVRPALDGGEVEVFDSGVRTPEVDAAIVAKVFAAAEASSAPSDNLPSPGM